MPFEPETTLPQSQISHAIIPRMEQAHLDLDRQKQAKKYARIQRRMMVVDLVIAGSYILIWLFSGWPSELKELLLGWTQNPWLLVAGFAALFGGLLTLINLPLAFYVGYILPHRFELSNQTLPGWITDQIKGGFLSGILGLSLLEVIYAVLRAAPETWWLWAAGIMLFFSLILANLAPILIFPLFYKFVPLGEEYSELETRLVELAEQAGTRVRGVYKFDMSRRTKAANAALTGLGRTRRIILGDTLLKEFSAEEVETVLAHELGHHVNRDIPTGIFIESVITLGGLYLAHLGLQWGVARFGFDGVWDVAAMPLFALTLGLFGLITMPLTNAYSRWRERKADDYALQVTHKQQAFASAMTRLANQNLAEYDPEPWVVWLLYSHPPLNERIARANQAG